MFEGGFGTLKTILYELKSRTPVIPIAVNCQFNLPLIYPKESIELKIYFEMRKFILKSPKDNFSLLKLVELKLTRHK